MNDLYLNEMVNSNYNVAVLTNLVLEETNSVRLKVGDTEKTEKLVHLAASKVLGDLNPYKSGRKKISDKQCHQIKKEIVSIKKQNINKSVKRANYLARKAQRLESMITTLRSSPREFSEKLEDFYQVMGCIVSYGKWKKGDKVLGPDNSHSDYTVQKIIRNKKGLQLIILVPTHSDDRKSAPIICCRGTTSNPHNLIDDMNHHIGLYSFEKSKEEIAETLHELTATYGSVVLAGHSLGGAIAQTITAEFCDQTNEAGVPLIKSCYHFSSPGVGEEAATAYEAKKQSIPVENQPKVYEYYHAGDLVVLAGGEHLAPDLRKEVGSNSVSNFTSTQSLKETHSWPKLISEYNQPRVVKELSPRRVKLKKAIEYLRKSIAKIVRRVMLKHVHNREKLKELANQLSDFLHRSSENRAFFVVSAIEELEANFVAN